MTEAITALAPAELAAFGLTCYTQRAAARVGGAAGNVDDLGYSPLEDTIFTVFTGTGF